MATKTVLCEVKKVEHVDGFLVNTIKVTAGTYGTSITFEVPEHRAASYTIGRMVEVSVRLREAKSRTSGGKADR